MHSCLIATGWLFWDMMANPLLGEESYTSPPRWLRTAARNVVQKEGDSSPDTRRSRLNKTMVPLFVSPCTLLVVLASSTSGDL
jgi:hypothetical protein